MRRTLFIALVMPLAFLLGACSKPAPVPEPVRAVRTMTVSAGAATGAVEYAADIRARTETRLSFRVGGKMIERSVDAGQRVRAGQVLARLDSEDLRLGQQAAQAAVHGAQVNRDLAAADFERFKGLRDQGFISAAELQRRETTLRSAEAQLVQARAQGQVQGNQAGYATLTAPAAGVVTAVDAEPGAVLAAGSPVLRLALDGPRDVVFAVPEDVVARVRRLIGRPGSLSVRLWAGDARFPATLREVAAAADPVTRTFLARADIGAAAVDLGQTASVTLTGDDPHAALVRVPLTAVAERQGRPSVWVLDRSTMSVRSRPIEVEAADGSELRIRGGLSAGDTIVTAGIHVLTEGQVVKTLAAAAPPPAAPASAAASAPASAPAR